MGPMRAFLFFSQKVLISTDQGTGWIVQVGLDGEASFRALGLAS